MESSSEEDKKPVNSAFKKWARFSGIGFQLGATIWLGSIVGKWVDEKWPVEGVSWFNIITLLSIGLGMYAVIKEVLKITNDN